MLSQSQVKHIAALKVKKFRGEHRQFIAEGHKLVLDLLGSDFKIAGIYASASWIVENLPLIREKNIPVFETLPREMERITALSTPSPVLAVVGIPHPNPSPIGEGQVEGALILALDDIRDPGNMGTIIRIADWFGIGTVLCSESCVDVYNPKVVQATMGSIVRVKVIACNLAEAISTLSGSTTPSGCPVYGTFLEGESVFTQTLTDHGVIVIGNESRGISPELIPFITRKLYIPSLDRQFPGKLNHSMPPLLRPSSVQSSGEIENKLICNWAKALYF
jgi:RNA methyltransferase, TrmH family